MHNNNNIKTSSEVMHDPAVDSEQFRQDLKTYLYSLDTRGDSALEVLRNRAQYIDIYIYITDDNYKCFYCHRYRSNINKPDIQTSCIRGAFKKFVDRHS